jgi:hypothetical protein
MSMIIDGTNGLTFNNATTQASAGQVLQVVQNTYSTEVTNTTTSYADSGLSASITPKFSTSKILVIVSQPLGAYRQENSTTGAFIRLLRSSTAICTITNASQIRAGVSVNGFIAIFTVASLSFLDSPATTSSTTYKTQFTIDSTGSSATSVTSYSGGTATITLLEIAQ